MKLVSALMAFLLAGIASTSFGQTPQSQPPEKPRVAVIDFTEKGQVGIPDAGKTVAELLLTKFGQDRYQLVERSQLAALLKEIDLTMALVQEDPQKVYGKLKGVKYLVLGSVNKLGNITVTARIVDMAKGDIVQTAEVSANDARGIQDAISDLARLLQMTAEEKKAALTTVPSRHSEWLLRAMRYAATVKDRRARSGIIDEDPTGRPRFLHVNEGRAIVYRGIAKTSGEMKENGIYQEAVRLARANADSMLPSMDARDLSGVQAKLKDISGALETAKLILDAELRFYAYTDIAREASLSERPKEYKECLTILQRLAEAEPKEIKRQYDLTALAEMQADVLDVPGLETTLALLVDRGGKNPTEYSIGITTEELLGKEPKNFRQNGAALLVATKIVASQGKDIERMVAGLEDDYQRATALARVAQISARKGDDTLAVKALRMLNTPGWQAEGWYRVGRIWRDQKGHDANNGAIVQMLAVADRLDKSDRNAVLEDVAHLQSSIGDIEGIRKSLDGADDISRMSMTIDLAHAYARKGAYYEAMRLIDGVAKKASEHSWDDPYVTLSRIQAEAGHLKAATETALRVHSTLERGECWQVIGSVLGRQETTGDQEKWVESLETAEEKAFACLGIAQGMWAADAKPK